MPAQWRFAESDGLSSDNPRGDTLLQTTDLTHLKAILFDLDGVVYIGSLTLPGAQEVFDWLDLNGRPYCLVTNNSTRTPLQYQQKLLAMGIRVPLHTVFTSAMATAQYLNQRYPTGTSAYMIGEDGLTEALVEGGFRLVNENPALVCVGLDQSLTYAKLRAACLAIRAGAAFIATNPDRTLPTEAGLVPGNGATLSALQTATDVSPVVIGKPSATMIDLAIERIGGLKGEVAIIGDRLDTDIEAGNAAGIQTILILTGVHRLEDVPRFPATPEYVVDDLVQFREALAGRPVARRYQASPA
jgi:4-nitrophenyl phosphatase